MVVKIYGIQSEGVDRTVFDPSYGFKKTGTTMDDAERQWEDQAIGGWFFRYFHLVNKQIVQSQDGPVVAHGTGHDPSVRETDILDKLLG